MGNCIRNGRTINNTQTNENWQELTTISKEQIEQFGSLTISKGLQPSYYLDINGKEWIILLTPECRGEAKTVDISVDDHEAYLYDVENDKLFAFIHRYREDINERFNIEQSDEHGTVDKSRCFVIDNNNHVMYWLICGETLIPNALGYLRSPYGLIIAFDIKDLKNIQFIYQQMISYDEYPEFGYCICDYTMLMVGNTIQFVLGGKDQCKHYEFNIKTRKLKAVVDSIHSRYIDNVTWSKVVKFFENLKIGDCIDARDSYTVFYLAQVLDIKDKIFDKNNRLESMKVKVHYPGWQEKFDEWIDVIKNIKETNGIGIDGKSNNDNSDVNNKHLLTSLCCCDKKCYFSKWESHGHKKVDGSEKYCQFHRITLPKCQSLRPKGLQGLNAVYSKSKNKLIILGSNFVLNPYARSLQSWSGLYYKYIDDPCHCLVNGFIHRIKKFIPTDLHKIIFDYYFIPHWSHAIKTDKNGKFVRNMFAEHFQSNSACVVVNNDNDIYIFGGNTGIIQSKDILRLNIATNTLRRVLDVKYPLSCNSFAVFCKKSRRIHLFATNFSRHVSISLKKLNKAASVLIDE